MYIRRYDASTAGLSQVPSGGSPSARQRAEAGACGPAAALGVASRSDAGEKSVLHTLAELTTGSQSL
jgi:hypothetical protein